MSLIDQLSCNHGVSYSCSTPDASVRAVVRLLSASGGD